MSPGDQATPEAACASWPFAVVAIRSKVDGAVRHGAAAFLFDTPDGFAWVEPKYKDPNGAGQNAFHRLVAKVTPTCGGFTFDGPDWSGTIEPYEPTVAQIEAIGDVFEWLESLGLDLEKERIDLKRVLRQDLR